ncbi:hypothetical protein [Kluyvera huaxiensis]
MVYCAAFTIRTAHIAQKSYEAINEHT